MPDPLETRILSHLKSDRYSPKRPKALAQDLNVEQEGTYHNFRGALRDLMAITCQ